MRLPAKTPHAMRVGVCLLFCSAACRLVDVRYDLPDFRRCMLPAKRRSGNQIFAHRQSADDDGVETNLSDEA